ncbi:Hypothetical predicted protein [Mytilus galloprovincialis]|uniref:Uncharacterized protein n=1 Tax=Mytilus galloprovincialis TaxID=29158 RepID=A0A8B6BFE1_MYTGA|nr:Hypothetical predicted protein [Mytilus galloprovincialis]
MKSLLVFTLVVSTATAAIDESRIKLIERKFEDLARQLMLTELAMGERARSDEDSGIKQIRITADGTQSYFDATHTFNSVCSIHEHSNYDRTVGMGEFTASLNGIEFRTRHNDYRLSMPHRTKKDFHLQENIPFPAVPPSVLRKPTLQEQIQEMHNYFRAFSFQNFHFRDYRPYFKPVLCYLEGTWTVNTKTLNEPFESDRHHIDAASWFDLQEKIRFTSYTGGKHYLENFSYLPTTIMNMVNGTPEYAQWNYRIACHPLKKDLPLAAMKPVDDMAARIGHRWNITRFSHSRAARFVLAPDYNGNRNKYHWQDGYGSFPDRRTSINSVLDGVMSEIPGKDNYPAKLTDTTFGKRILDPRVRNATELNTGYYHRYFRHERKGAMGTFNAHRGYSDRNLFVAQTSNPKVAEMKIKWCGKDEHTHKPFCKEEGVRYSYAIPLEIIYLNPLMSWNPYNLEYITDHRQKYIVTKNGRNGGFTSDKAYNGTTYDKYYRTPVEFYHTKQTTVDKDAADTARGGVGVLDRHGNVKKVLSAGVRITLPEIPGVGKIRMRYPIMPITSEGNQIGKEVEAVKDVLNHLETMGGYLQERPSALSGGGNSKADAHFRTSVTNQDPPGHHFHEMFIPNEDMIDLGKGHTITVVTTTDNSHDHKIEVSYDQHTHKYIIHKCDGQDKCWDGHTADLLRIT